MARRDLLILADLMERDLNPAQYCQRFFSNKEETCGCAAFWSDKFGLRRGPLAQNYELRDGEFEYLFGVMPDRDCSLAGTIAALREVGAS